MTSQEAPLILAIDTSTRACTVALTRGGFQAGELIGVQVFNSSITHSRRLLSSIDSLIIETETDWADLDCIAVGLGPGSFTGLRIGLSTAKGLVASASIPLVGVSTLDCFAAGCTTDKMICSVIDARKKEVYTAFYRKEGNGLLTCLQEVVAISPETLAEQITEPVLMVGDGVNTYGNLWQEKLGELVELAPATLNIPNAANIGFLSHGLYEKEELLDPSDASPLYVRASDAELSLGKKMG